jgi:hypothetical protein
MKRSFVLASLLAAMLMLPGYHPVGYLPLELKAAAMQRSDNNFLNPLAERYVRLVLALGLHDTDYVDAYYGPPEWKADVEREKPSLAEIQTRAAGLERDLVTTGHDNNDEMVALRYTFLVRQLQSLQARAAMKAGKRYTFDEESKALYDAVAPTHTEAELQALLASLDAALPGQGSLLERLDAFRSRFVIPRDRLDATFTAAIEACRDRTQRYVQLPENESFTVEYVTNKSWSGYNWYQGGFRSLIQVNTDLPVYIDRALDLACHEGYPGHHVYNALLEQHLVKERGWLEFTVYPLFSPQSLIAEGTANYGIEVAFPGRERAAFERSKLFPLAGIDPGRAVEYYEVQELVERLSYAGNEAARRYLDGKIDRETATAWLQRYALMPRERAAQRVRFFDQYRSYVINYNYGKDLVRTFIESRGGTADNPAKRWQEFEKLLSSPRLPSGLR